MNTRNICAIACLMLSLINPLFAQDGNKGLKDFYTDYFNMGVAVGPRVLTGEESELILRHFNSLTAENAMKMGPIHPEENQYYWKDADSIASFAQRNNLKLRGHTLLWHNQTPKWMFTDANGQPISKELLLRRLQEHITTVVKRYKGQVYAWDVVNEAISDKPDEVFRKSQWFDICGEECIEKAFQWAHEADPEALLFYNDYNEIVPGKREKIIAMIKSLRNRGVPIHGVGLQAHWSIYSPSREALESTLKDFSELGVQVQITELDVSVYPKEQDRRGAKPSETAVEFTSELETKQAEAYKMYFDLFRKYRHTITGVTFWNVSDKRSWLDNFPVRGRKDYPLLFDQELKPKKAYWEAVRF